MAKITDMFTKGSGAPGSTPGASAIAYYLRTSNNHLYVWDGSAWQDTDTGGGGGSASFSWVTKSADYTVLTTDTGVVVDATSINIVINLPTAVSATQQYTIKKKDSSTHTVTVDANSTETIDGALTVVLSLQYESITIMSDGTNWFIA